VDATIRPHRLGLLAGAGILMLLSLAGPAAAAEPIAGASIAGPCTLDALSTDAGGTDLDELAGPGTSEPTIPFDVDRSGKVAWTGTGPAITTGSWQISIYGVPLPVLSGSIDNPDGQTSADGVVLVGDILPVDIVGTFEVSGSVSGDGGSCSGSAWVRVDGNPLTSIPGIAGIGLGIVGLLTLLTSLAGRHPWRGLFGGLVLGLAVGILAIVFGIVPIGTITPWVALAGGSVIGLILGLLPIGGGAAAA
jgi:hypothetical protein